MADAYGTSTALADFNIAQIANAAMLTFTDFTENGMMQAAFNVAPLMPEGAISFNAGKLPAVTMQSVTEGTAIDRKQYSASTKTLTVNTKKADPITITDFAHVGSGFSLWPAYAETAGAACRKAIAASLAALYTSASNSVTNATTANITEANVATAKTYLDNANAPQEGRKLVLAPVQYNALKQISRFTESQTIGKDGISQGRISYTLHGFELLMDQNIVAASGLTRNIACVVNPNPLMSSFWWAAKPFKNLTASNTVIAGSVPRLVFSYDDKYVSEIMTAEIFYGVAIPRPEWVVEIQGQD